MAGSRFAYVKKFELPDTLLPNTFMVFRLDGHSFHRWNKFCKIRSTVLNFSFRFTDEHGFVKPNDVRALELMDRAAKSLMEEYHDISLGFGESDEYRYIFRSRPVSFPISHLAILDLQGSFLLRKSTSLYNRRQSKIVSTLTSLFTSCYVFHWPKYFPDLALRYPPSFDGRIVLYPSQQEVRDYFAWRQTDSTQLSIVHPSFCSPLDQHTSTIFTIQLSGRSYNRVVRRQQRRMRHWEHVFSALTVLSFWFWQIFGLFREQFQRRNMRFSSLALKSITTN